MRNLRRRIETLEKSRSGQRDALRTVAEKALSGLWPNDLECLIAAYGADRVGRPLTECEAAAKRAYTEALERERRWAGLSSTTGSVLILDLRHAFINVLAFRLSGEVLELCDSGTRAIQKVVRQTKKNQPPSSPIIRN
jgi:hypothetical protein